MADEDKVVQTDEVRDDASKEGEVQEGTEQETKEQPLTKEDVAEMLRVQKAEISSHFQSVKDREVKKFAQEASSQRRRAETAEAGMEATKTAFKDMTPENREALELAELKARDKVYGQREVEERQRQAVETFDVSFKDKMNQFIQGEGIDPSDKRIDWGEDAGGDYLERMGRIQTSISKINKESRTKFEVDLKGTIKDELAKTRKDLGLDSVDTDISSGVSKGVPTDMTKFREWVSGLSQKEWKEKKKDIDEMMSKGLIK